MHARPRCLARWTDGAEEPQVGRVAELQGWRRRAGFEGRVFMSGEVR